MLGKGAENFNFLQFKKMGFALKGVEKCPQGKEVELEEGEWECEFTLRNEVVF